MDFNANKYFLDESHALTEAEKVEFARDLRELELRGMIEFRNGRWQLAAGAEVSKTASPCGHCGDPIESESFSVHCETCKKPLTLCEDCWNDSDDCPACEDRRDEEQWCPLCDTPLAKLAEDKKQAHLDECRACTCVLDLEDGSTIQGCRLHPKCGSPKQNLWRKR